MERIPDYAILTWEGYAEKPEPQVSRTDMETGPAKQVRLRSRSVTTRPVQYLFASVADYLAFKSWVNNAIYGGADWFLWTDPVDGIEKQARMSGGSYEGAPWGEGGEWLVKFTLESW